MDTNRPLSTDGLQVIEVSKRFGGRQAVSHASFNVAQDEIVALIGPNGSGKTTLYNILTALERPDTGTILLDGQDITRLPGFGRARLGLSYLPQAPSVFRGLSVRDNLALVLEARIPDRALRAARLRALLEQFDLTGLAETMPVALSGGQLRRCEIARALASEPRYLLLDEPFAGLDPIRIAELSDMLAALARSRIGILVTDHNIRAVLAIADRVIVLASGTILGTGTPESVLVDAGLRSAFLPPDFAL